MNKEKELLEKLEKDIDEAKELLDSCKRRLRRLDMLDRQSDHGLNEVTYTTYESGDIWRATFLSWETTRRKGEDRYRTYGLIKIENDVKITIPIENIRFINKEDEE